MFCSNQKFEITGDYAHKESLRGVLRLLIDSYNFHFAHYKIENGKMYFFSYISDGKGATDIPKADRNVEYLSNLINLYMSSSSWNEGYRFVDCYNGDGSNHEGWRFYIDRYEYYDCLIIEPYYCYYSK